MKEKIEIGDTVFVLNEILDIFKLNGIDDIIHEVIDCKHSNGGRVTDDMNIYVFDNGILKGRDEIFTYNDINIILDNYSKKIELLKNQLKYYKK